MAIKSQEVKSANFKKTLKLTSNFTFYIQMSRFPKGEMFGNQFPPILVCQVLHIEKESISASH